MREARPGIAIFEFYCLLFSRRLVRMSRRRDPPTRISNHHFDLRGSEMQIVSRRENEGLVIDDDISVTVLKIRNNYVRLAISCPRMTPSYWEQTLFLEAKEEASHVEMSILSL
jgi:carbon storage regulator CsrA